MFVILYFFSEVINIVLYWFTTSNKPPFGILNSWKNFSLHQRFTSGVGIAYPSGAPAFISDFKWGSCYSIFSFMCIFCRSLFVLFLLTIVLSVLLRVMDSDYPFGILKLFFQMKWHSWWSHHCYALNCSIYLLAHSRSPLEWLVKIDELLRLLEII